MKILKLSTSVITALILGTSAALVAAPAANAANLVDCGSRTDFVKLFHDNGDTACFANSGTVIIPVNFRTTIYKITTGNNSITLSYSDGVKDFSQTYGKWSTVTRTSAMKFFKAINIL
ncbi:beta/gamma crystallin domain-containing protein [Psychromicrobium lacuslunae]|uniref:Streptomyces killer toxin-like beta/gamma crystallin domain-containing protein n=1 Tax=Psychromicrobium lacuslunae TaxID=1618207 RepID=A0A0D4BZJ9_9MICC|nr:beta/gamma crystallin domain-containing protein [Psychromicrobium lacuslunae]AJT41877.1 hypothetical protein UM93_10775 [Psychromicrobium lacuslunae]